MAKSIIATAADYRLLWSIPETSLNNCGNCGTTPGSLGIMGKFKLNSDPCCPPSPPCCGPSPSMLEQFICAAETENDPAGAVVKMIIEALSDGFFEDLSIPLLRQYITKICQINTRVLANLRSSEGSFPYIKNVSETIAHISRPTPTCTDINLLSQQGDKIEDIVIPKGTPLDILKKIPTEQELVELDLADILYLRNFNPETRGFLGDTSSSHGFKHSTDDDSFNAHIDAIPEIIENAENRLKYEVGKRADETPIIANLALLLNSFYPVTDEVLWMDQGHPIKQEMYLPGPDFTWVLTNINVDEKGNSLATSQSPPRTTQVAFDKEAEHMTGNIAINHPPPMHKKGGQTNVENMEEDIDNSLLPIKGDAKDSVPPKLQPKPEWLM